MFPFLFFFYFFLLLSLSLPEFFFFSSRFDPTILIVSRVSLAYLGYVLIGKFGYAEFEFSISFSVLCNVACLLRNFGCSCVVWVLCLNCRDAERKGANCC